MVIEIIQQLTPEELHKLSVEHICQDLIEHITDNMGLDTGEVDCHYQIFREMEELDLVHFVFYLSQRFGIDENKIGDYGKKIRGRNKDYTLTDVAKALYDHIHGT